VIDRPHSASSPPRHASRRGLFRGRRRRAVLLVATLVLTVGGAVVGYYLGRSLAAQPLLSATKQVQQLQPENQRLKTANLDLNAKLVSLQGQLTKSQTTLEAIMPSDNTYNIAPNQSIIVANGRLTIGLIGAPTNSTVNVNINGKQQSAVTGDVFKITPDQTTTCQVRVQSFDMFRAILSAACTATTQ
jgi:cell division protein FtsB